MTIFLSFLIVCAFVGGLALFVWAVENQGYSKWADRSLWLLGVFVGLLVLVSLTLGVNDIFFSGGGSVE
jgi:peptidoglycan/LPS O-acetylase OafA/YrhL